MLVRCFSLIIILLLLSGCAMKWAPDLAAARRDASTPETIRLLGEADRCFASAAEKSLLEQCEKGYLEVLNVNPGSYGALTQLSTINILYGTAYADRRSRKNAYFLAARRYAERALFTNDRFRERVAGGESLWEAVNSLTAAEKEAMFFWVTALQYQFKEGMSLPAKVVNIRWLQRSLVVLEHLERVAPDFGGGGVEFAKAICYYALPERYGGSEKMGDAAMRVALDRGDGWLLPRWAMGKYYYPVVGRSDKAREELAWVARQNPAAYKDPYPWRIHFIENAAALIR